MHPADMQRMSDLLREARIGSELEVATSSALYQFLMRAADMAAEKHLDDLLSADPSDVGAVAAEQANIRALREMKRWIDDTIHRGEQAAREFDAANAD